MQGFNKINSGGSSSFFFLGLLIGVLVGFSAEPVTGILISSLFTFLGGSIIVLMKKITNEDRAIVFKLVSVLSLGCLIGVFGSILIAEYQLLTPTALRQTQYDRDINPVDRKVLRSNDMTEIAAIEQRVRAGHQSKEDAYDDLIKLLRRQE